MTAILQSIMVTGMLLVSITAAGANEMIDADSMTIAMSGHRLTNAEHERLVAVLNDRPDDHEARLRLVGYYFGKQSATRSSHVLWVIKNMPTSDIAGSPFCSLDRNEDAKAFAEGVRLWQAHTAPGIVKPEVLLHAAVFLEFSDWVGADLLLRRGMRDFPRDPRFPARLARSLMTCIPARPAEAFPLFEQALLVTVDEAERYYLLDDVAEAAVDAGKLEQAKTYAMELLAMADRIDDWNTGNAIHHGNLILGRIALLDNNVELASAYLLKAGGTKGSPQLDSFGPNMRLAKELLEHGQRVPVLAYFDLCATFWKSKELVEWKKQVESGGMPDFGGNLSY